MAACCALSAYIIYKLISIHSSLPSLAQEPSTDLELDSKKAKSCLITLRGLTCASCVTAVEDACLALPGVLGVNVSLHALTARIQLDPDQVSPEALVAEIETAGFEAEPQPNEEEQWASQWLTATRAKEETLRKWTRAFTSSTIVSGLVYLLEMVDTWVLVREPTPLDLLSMATLSITATAAFHLGRPIHKEAWWAFTRRRPNASLLASAGVIFTLLAAVHQRVNPSAATLVPFRMTSVCLLMTVIIGGRVSKCIISQRGNQYPAVLASSIPQTAQVLKGAVSLNTNPISVPVEILHHGDIIRVDPQAQFPADCRIVVGHTSVLETIVNGEVLPRTVGLDDYVYAGSTNSGHRVAAEVCHVGNETWLGQTLKAMEQTSEAKSTSPASFSDRMLARFSSTVICLATVTGIYHWLRGESLATILPRIATVLLCACPCTIDMGMSMGIMATVAAGSKAGILLRPGVQIEQAARARAIIFDKTGTLTAGELQIQHAHLEPPWDADRHQFWHLVGLLTQNSHHPVSALLSAASQEHLSSTAHIPISTLLSHEEHPGLGLSGTFSSSSSDETTIKIAIGTLRLMQINNVYPHPRTTSHTTSSVYISINNHLAGQITYTDPIIPDTTDLIQSLHQRSFTTFIMTGDTKAAAATVAQQIGIPESHVHASLLPRQKADLVASLEARYGPTIMVGDNLNDGPALAAATLGILVSHRSSSAAGSSALSRMQSAAHALLVADGNSERGRGLRRVVDTVELLRRASRRMRLVLYASVVYNAVALCLASGVLRGLVAGGGVGQWVDLDPSSASFAMSVSSILTLLFSSQLSDWTSGR
ncbi:hypothetical protein FE257_011738 [Aspergillus nanangensis]|uniref:HMA domain-containing protein n=1 Tax=Aspergillus nanangensis TaxID=2582783 RepID=A0AAD4GZ52_ASPNN|nr:hypothetical protein FE257_011738 [Aspergillus nanangensis]